MQDATPAPPFAYDWPELEQCARSLLAGRTVGYPPAVDKGTMTREQSEFGIRVATAIVNDLMALIAHEPLAPDARNDAEKRADLHRTCERAAQIAAADPADGFKADYAKCLRAIAWLYEPWMHGMPTSRIRFFSDLNFNLRRPALAEAA